VIIVGEGQILSAFHSAKREIQAVHKSEEADMGKYTVKYASLNAVLAEVERVCGQHNIVVMQEPTVVEGMFGVLTTLVHSDGSYLVFAPMCLPLPKEAQAVGSATTYLRRYSLTAQFGIPVEDDDGKAATVAAQTQPGRRTEAERLIREEIAKMENMQRGLFTADFQQVFRSNLTDLPASKHGDALTWTRQWVANWPTLLAERQAVQELAEAGMAPKVEPAQ